MADGKLSLSIRRRRLAQGDYITVLSSVLHQPLNCTPRPPCFCTYGRHHYSLSTAEPWQGEGTVFNSLPKSTFKQPQSCSGLLHMKMSVCHLACLGDSVLQECPGCLSKSSPARSFSLRSRLAELEARRSSAGAALFGSDGPTLTLGE